MIPKHTKNLKIIVGVISSFWLVIYLFSLCGCINFKTKLPNGDDFLYQKMLVFTSAKKAEFYYEDPNTVFWIILNDPCSRVNPGSFKIKEPYTGIELSGEAK